jgi:phospholipase/carboxylesterase
MTSSRDHRGTRRSFLATTGRAILAAAAVPRLITAQSAPATRARLSARPGASVTRSLTTGPLGLGAGDRDGVIQMPTSLRDGSAPLLLFLHGATQNGAAMLRRIGPAADAAGVVVVAPDSRGPSWDAIRGDFGEDVAFLNQVLTFVFARLAVDPAQVALGGFSDGASYALSLGLANGDLFPRVLACSPGFVIQAPPQGRPRVFVSHGRSDQILPIDQCSRVIVPRLQAMRYDVTYREFDGRHELPPAVATEAMAWMTAR